MARRIGAGLAFPADPGVKVPTYICRAPETSLNGAAKLQLAEAITRIHARVTGGAAALTQVLFRGVQQGDCYVGGRELHGPHCFIQGHIRAGRSAVERAELIRELLPSVSDILGVPRYAVWVYLSELPSRAMAEFGHMLPEPGNEDVWLDALPEEDRRRFRSLDVPSP